MIKELLGTGAGNARTARELAEVLHCEPRDITRRIQAERLQGAPICATSDGNNPGYYLAEDEHDLEAYCRRLLKRAGEIFRTRRALLQALAKMRTG